MKQNKDYAWVLYLFILAIAVLASSCKDKPKTIPIDSYPYQWDTAHYSRILCSKNKVSSVVNIPTVVKFKKKSIEIHDADFMDESVVILTGEWTSFVKFSADSGASVFVGPITHEMSITYRDGTKEIYDRE
jgi:hypothetical protein